MQKLLKLIAIGIVAFGFFGCEQHHRSKSQDIPVDMNYTSIFQDGFDIDRAAIEPEYSRKFLEEHYNISRKK